MPTCLRSRPSITGKDMRSRIDKLLLHYLCAVPDETHGGRLEALSNHDWDLFMKESFRHGIAPLLYHRLQTFYTDISIPANVIEKLRQAYLGNAARNMALYNRLGRVLKALQDAGVSVIVLKGAHLANVTYRNIALRQMCDVDLLVKQADLSKVHDIMVEQGYVSSKEEIFCDPNHPPPYSKENSPLIEAHFNIIGPPFSHRVDLAKLWARAQKVSVEGIEALALCPEDLLLHLCAHAGFKHGFDGGSRQLLDISYTVEHYASVLNWGEVLKRGKEWGVSKCLYLCLSLTKKFAGAPIPEEIMKKLNIYNDNFDAMTRAEEFLFGEGGPIATNLARLYGDENLRDKLAHFMKYAFPPKNIMANMNLSARNPFAVYFLYFFRIKGLLKRHGKTAWRLLLRDKEMSVFTDVENRRSALKGWLMETE